MLRTFDPMLRPIPLFRPFRNRPSFFNALHDSYSGWSPNTKTFIIALDSPATTLLVGLVGVVVAAVMSARSHARQKAVAHLELRYNVACHDIRTLTETAKRAGLVYRHRGQKNPAGKDPQSPNRQKGPPRAVYLRADSFGADHLAVPAGVTDVHMA